MARSLGPGDRIVVASHNPGKVAEIRELLAPYGVETASAVELGLEEPEETGSSFAANAEIKAVSAAEASGLASLADDSGLEVQALGGAPGIRSARWAGEGRNFAEAMARVERELQARGARDAEDRRANFTCALTVAWPDGHTRSFEGKVHGQLVWPPRGARGFGYDPMFLADGHDVTFGEMSPAAKHAISHRARAFQKFVSACLTPPKQS